MRPQLIVADETVVGPAPAPSNAGDDLHSLKVIARMVKRKVNLMVKSIASHGAGSSTISKRNGRWERRSAYEGPGLRRDQSPAGAPQCKACILKRANILSL